MLSKTLPRDVHRPCVELLDDDIVDVLKHKTAAERIAMVFDAERTIRLMLQADIAWRHPDWTYRRVSDEVARRFRSGSG
jgi:hypothetical protein